MQVELNYGRHTLPVELPDDVQVSVVRKPPMPVLPDPLAAVRKALQEPVGAASLDQLAGNARSATIAICDITRPVPRDRTWCHSVERRELGVVSCQLLVVSS